MANSPAFMLYDISLLWHYLIYNLQTNFPAVSATTRNSNKDTGPKVLSEAKALLRIRQSEAS